ncbi:hypothetical protein COB11_08570 [Candidatus Aerophobetes bacterium]|uniref:Uncharacterized protein n=1 Tax=Aerophobetes bacterium TaxID=2030807 RepID=A0A2A4Y947_UNCAE|nr:MAG: hypothetical protein COB11_08570 [Candidatus Aerophobetes bacterium]
MSRVDRIESYGNRINPNEAIYASFLEQIETHFEIAERNPNGPNSPKARNELLRIREDISCFMESGINGLGPLLSHRAFDLIK